MVTKEEMIELRARARRKKEITDAETLGFMRGYERGKEDYKREMADGRIVKATVDENGNALVSIELLDRFFDKGYKQGKTDGINELIECIRDSYGYEYAKDLMVLAYGVEKKGKKSNG